MTSKKKRKYGDLTDQTVSSDPEIFAEVFAAFTGHRPPTRASEATKREESQNDSPAPQTTPARRATPAQHAAPAQNAPEPLHRAAAAQHATPAPQTTVAGFTRIPNELLDRILPTLDTYDQSVLVRLYRLAWGFSSDTCRVSVPTLAKACNISERQTRKSIVRLEGRELIERVEQDFGNKNIALRGTTFRVLISEPSPARRATPAQYTTPAQRAAQAHRAANKENTHKENTQTQMGVGAGSKFTKEECRRYADHLRSTGQGITNPGGYATAIHRTGEADHAIDAFLNPVQTSNTVDVSTCPDCQGTGWTFPDGPSGGAAKCKHPNLSQISQITKAK